MPAMPSLLRRNIPRATWLLGLALAACGSTTGSNNPAPSCGADPFACAASTTCWPIDRKGAAACLPSKGFKVRGDDCELLLGDTSCPDGMVCATAATLRLDGSVVQSFCAAYCDSKRGKGCAGDETCTPLTLFDGAPATSVCVPMSLPRDHAMDGGNK